MIRKLDQKLLDDLEIAISNKLGMTAELMKLNNFIKNCWEEGYSPETFEYFIDDTIKFSKVVDATGQLSEDGHGICIVFKFRVDPSPHGGSYYKDTVLLTRFPRSKISKAWTWDIENNEIEYYDYFLENIDGEYATWALGPVK